MLNAPKRCELDTDQKGESTDMAKLLSTALLALLILVACSETVPTSIITPTETPLPEATAPSDSQPVLTQPANPTQEPTPVATPPATATPTPTQMNTATPPPPATAAPNPTPTPIPTAIPSPTATSTPVPTATPSPTATSTPVPTATPSPTATSTPVPTATPSPTATSTPVPTATPSPTATSTPVPTATPSPTATSTPIPTATPSPTATSTPAPTQPPAQPSNLWRGITIAPENRCSPYDSDEYRYSPSVEPRIVAAQGGIYGPYTGTWFESIKETDIEHIVARSEAHDSGLCAAGPATWSEFASDLLNLTLASPSVNRHQKSDNDAAEWLPELNQCWYVHRTVQVRREYGLTIDRAEAQAIDGVLAGCQSTDMVVLAPGASATATATPTPTAAATPTHSPDVDALALWDDNGNGRITCAEARAHGIAPVHRGHPAYQYMRDADGDGVVCE